MQQSQPEIYDCVILILSMYIFARVAIEEIIVLPEQVGILLLVIEGGHSVREVAQRIGASEHSLYRQL